MIIRKTIASTRWTFVDKVMSLLFNMLSKLVITFLPRSKCHAGLDEGQAGIKIAGRNINNLRYADNTTLTAESEELKSLLMKVKEECEKEHERGELKR